MKYLICLLLLVSSFSYAKTCDVKKLENGFFHVTRDGELVGAADYLDWREAVKERDIKISSGFCDLSETKDMCDVEKDENGFYQATRDNEVYDYQFGNWMPAIELRNMLIKAKLCKLTDKKSVCDLAVDYGGYRIARDGEFFNYATIGNWQATVEERDMIINAKLCNLPAGLLTCKILNKYGSYTVLREDGLFSNGNYGNIGAAETELNMMINSFVCK